MYVISLKFTMDEDTFGNEPVIIPKSSPRLKLSSRKTISQFIPTDQTYQKEIERMRRDIAEKNAQILNFQGQVKIFKECSTAIRELIRDLESSTGQQFLTKDQRQNFDHMPHNEGILVIKKAMNYLIKEYNSLPDKFSETFEQNVNKITDEIERVEQNTRNLALKRKQLQKDLNTLDRVISIHKTEKQSLYQLAQSLQDQLNEQENEAKANITARTTQLTKLKQEIQKTNMDANDQDLINNQINQQLVCPVAKRHSDMLKDDKELEAEYEKLTAYLEREKREHELTRRELDHIQNEIARANMTIQRFKTNVNPETMKYATRVNSSMRNFICEQREEQKRKLIAQIKKNKDLERQINEMEEEQSMLIPYLAQVEKKLAAEMLKLPSLTDIQRRNEPEPKRALTRLNKRELDDPEMKSVKRTITRMKARRLRAKTAIGGR